MAETPRRRQGSHFASSSNGGSSSSQARRSQAQVQARHVSASHSSASHASAQTQARQAQQSSARQQRRHAASASQAPQAQQRRRAQASPGSTGMTSVATPRTRAQRQAAARGGHTSAAPIIGAFAALVAIVLVFVVFVLPRIGGSGEQAATGLVNEGSEVTVTIAEGSGAIAVGQALEEAGVIESASEFVTEAQRQRADSSLLSGTYRFTVGQDLDSIISRLTTGPNGSTTLTIPEGLTVTQTASRVEDATGITADEFTAQAKASNYVADYPFLAGAAAASADSLEGYLYPKTYEVVTSEASADTVIRLMLDQYAKEVATLDFASAEAAIQERYGIEMSDYDIITLASIVEREAITDDQRANVSSTFYNRLKIGMALQSDATYMYVTGGEVTYDDLVNDQSNPYNTRYNTGLTPTPICSPSIESINATLAPNETDYLYFYITQDTEQFSATYDEHLAAQN